MAKFTSFESPIPPEMKKLIEAQERIERITRPLSVSMSPLLEALQSLASQMAISNFEASSAVIATLHPAMESLATSIERLSIQIPKIAPIAESPVLNWLNRIAVLPPIFPEGYWQALASRLSFDPARYIEYYRYVLHNAKWFPLTGMQADENLALEITEILATSRDSKNRVKRLDQAIFLYYTKTRLETMKKEWRRMDLPRYLMRILHQAVQAYHRKEYALTTIVLATTWEGIIYAKVDDGSFKKDSKTKEYFAELLQENNQDDVFQDFFENYIVYNCKSAQEAIREVPGRHSLAHSMYESYPTRKAALNAILFTDFLLRLEPVSSEGRRAVG